MCSNEGKYAIWCDSDAGPSFGGDDESIGDIYIDSDSNTNKMSSSRLSAYRDHQVDQDEVKSILAGSEKFQSFEIEVFTHVFSSTILNNNRLIANLNQLCELELESCALIYKSSRDGFGSFHSKCDGIANTLTVVKATSGNIFGGFTTKPWSTIGKSLTDSNAFIFSLVNIKNKPFKVMCSNNGQNAIWCDADYGPTFGGNADSIGDIHIRCESQNQENMSRFGHSYQHPNYKLDSSKANKILAGSYQFEILEIEVYSKLQKY